ncbi:MAG: NAD(P)/FAD-dependent oxidoreductase [Betaproteobacteria bacterium]
MIERIDCVVIGAGVVGLAIARRMAMAGHDTIVLEAQLAIGTGTSSRNSEVIHAGIYYPQGSLKAKLCVEGRALLYEYCAAHGVEARRCGKLIVATTPGQMPELDAIVARAAANGVADLQRLEAAEARALEPDLHCVAAVLSPSTGIIDSHALMLALQGDFEHAGGMVAFGAPVASVRCDGEGITVATGGDAPMEITAARVINSAGLYAPCIAARTVGLPAQFVPVARYAKGNYYSLSGRAPFSRLIYPVPEAAGLGVHLTLDLAGQARFGPDVEWLEVDDPGAIDYTVDPRRADGFYAEIRRYWPALKDGSLQPAYSGVRPKLQAPGAAVQDFVIQGPRVHGVEGLVNLFGIESPGLTSSLAIGGRVAKLLEA